MLPGLDNPVHLLILLVVVLLLFGAKRLPEMGRSLGTGLREFKTGIAGHDSGDKPAPTLASQRERSPAG